MREGKKVANFVANKIFFLIGALEINYNLIHDISDKGRTIFRLDKQLPTTKIVK